MTDIKSLDALKIVRKGTLAKYIQLNNDPSKNHKQRSPEWYEKRSKSFGGSELAALMGKNRYKTSRSLIIEKVRGSTFTGSIATRWGVLFENVTKIWTEKLLRMEEAIEEMPSVNGFTEGQHFSPDGLGIVCLKNVDDEKEWYIVLFEFKAPFSTIPDGYVPPQYIPQLQAGLHSIGVAHLAIFVNNMYRLCALDSLDFTPSCMSRDNDPSGLQCSSCGIILMYADQEKIDLYNAHATGTEYISGFKDIDFDIFAAEKPVDFSRSDLTPRVFELFERGDITADFSAMYLNSTAVRTFDIVADHAIATVPQLSNDDIRADVKKKINEFAAKCAAQNKKFIGFVPWKLMMSDVLIETREDGWKEKVEPLIKDGLLEIARLRNQTVDEYEVVVDDTLDLDDIEF